MRRFITLILCSCVITFMQAQQGAFKNGISYKFMVTDYQTLDTNHQNAYDPDRLFHPDDVNYAGEIGYNRYINKHLNLAIPIKIGSIDSYHQEFDSLDVNCQPCQRRHKREFFFGLDVVAQYKFNNGLILAEDYFLAPYLIAGIGTKFMTRRGQFDVQVPLGIGLNIKLDKQLYLQAQFAYRKSLVIQKDNFGITGGIVWLLNGSKKNEDQ